jgi:hypothetical protein
MTLRFQRVALSPPLEVRGEREGLFPLSYPPIFLHQKTPHNDYERAKLKTSFFKPTLYFY